MAANMTRGQFGDLYTADQLPVLEVLFETDFRRHPMRRDLLANMKSTDRDIWQSTELHDLELFSEVPENTQYTYSKARQGADKTLKVVKKGGGFSISEEAVNDGKFDMIRRLVSKLAESGRETMEIDFMSLFNNGFSSESTADGLSLFNSAHTLPSGLTFRNVLSSSADLSESTLQTMLADYENEFIGDSGIKKMIRPRYLLVSEQNKRYARELVGSEKKPDTADNNMNSLKGDELQVISSPHLSDKDAWFLLSEPQDHGLLVINREGMRTTSSGPEGEGFHTDSIYYKAKYREVVGAQHPYGAFGTQGSGSA